MIHEFREIRIFPLVDSLLRGVLPLFGPEQKTSERFFFLLPFDRGSTNPRSNVVLSFLFPGAGGEDFDTAPRLLPFRGVSCLPSFLFFFLVEERESVEQFTFLPAARP